MESISGRAFHVVATVPRDCGPIDPAILIRDSLHALVPDDTDPMWSLDSTVDEPRDETFFTRRWICTYLGHRQMVNV